MEVLSSIFNLPIAQIVGLAMVVIFLQKAGIDVIGIVTKLVSKNGKENGNGHTKEKLSEIDEHLELLTSNHITHVQEGINDLKTSMQELLFITKDNKETLKDIRDILSK